MIYVLARVRIFCYTQKWEHERIKQTNAHTRTLHTIVHTVVHTILSIFRQVYVFFFLICILWIYLGNLGTPSTRATLNDFLQSRPRVARNRCARDENSFKKIVKQWLYARPGFTTRLFSSNFSNCRTGRKNRSLSKICTNRRRTKNSHWSFGGLLWNEKFDAIQDWLSEYRKDFLF